MQKALVNRFGFTTAAAGYLVTHCPELVGQILNGKCSESEIANVKNWADKLIKGGMA